jgi:hypothetical protein
MHSDAIDLDGFLGEIDGEITGLHDRLGVALGAEHF